MPLSRDEETLVERARAVILARYHPERHSVGAAIRTASGLEFAAVHLEANVGRIAVCAEAVALGMAAAAGDTHVELCVAVNARGEVVSPCGMCRELLSDYAPYCRVIVPCPGGAEAVPVLSLLPNKYR